MEPLERNTVSFEAFSLGMKSVFMLDRAESKMGVRVFGRDVATPCCFYSSVDALHRLLRQREVSAGDNVNVAAVIGSSEVVSGLHGFAFLILKYVCLAGQFLHHFGDRLAVPRNRDQGSRFEGFGNIWRSEDAVCGPQVRWLFGVDELHQVNHHACQLYRCCIHQVTVKSAYSSLPPLLPVIPWAIALGLVCS